MKEEEKNKLLESLLDKSGYDFTDSQLDQIGDTFAVLMTQIFG